MDKSSEFVIQMGLSMNYGYSPSFTQDVLAPFKNKMNDNFLPYN